MTQIDEPNLDEQIRIVLKNYDQFITTKQAISDIKALISDQVRQARLEEQNYHLDKLKTGKWKSYATEVTDRIKELEQDK